MLNISNAFTLDELYYIIFGNFWTSFIRGLKLAGVTRFGRDEAFDEWIADFVNLLVFGEFGFLGDKLFELGFVDGVNREGDGSRCGWDDCFANFFIDVWRGS